MVKSFRSSGMLVTAAASRRSSSDPPKWSSSVSIESAAGAQEGVLVDYRRYSSSTGDRLLAERWPDGPRTLIGRAVAPEDLQLWTKPLAAE
jgi:hypothetical protein